MSDNWRNILLRILYVIQQCPIVRRESPISSDTLWEENLTTLGWQQETMIWISGLTVMRMSVVKNIRKIRFIWRSHPYILPKASNLTSSDQTQQLLDIHFHSQITEFSKFGGKLLSHYMCIPVDNEEDDVIIWLQGFNNIDTAATVHQNNILNLQEKTQQDCVKSKQASSACN